MRPRLVPGLAFALLVILPTARGDEKADAAFAALMDEARKDPAKVDYPKLRAAYVESSGYQPYAEDRDEKQKAEKAFLKGDIDGALKIMKGLLEKKPLDLDHNAFTAFLYFKAGDAEKEKWHREFSQRMLKAIVQGRDGASYDGAYPVIDVNEEYFILGVRHLESKGQGLRSHEGHRYDVHEVKSEDDPDARPAPVFFNVDVPMATIAKTFQIKPK